MKEYIPSIGVDSTNLIRVYEASQKLVVVKHDINFRPKSVKLRNFVKENLFIILEKGTIADSYLFEGTEKDYSYFERPKRVKNIKVSTEEIMASLKDNVGVFSSRVLNLIDYFLSDTVDHEFIEENKKYLYNSYYDFHVRNSKKGYTKVIDPRVKEG